MNEYPATFVSPPKNAYDDLEIMETVGQTGWFAIVPLWSDEEGESDLCLMLHFVLENDEIRVVLRDCRVP